MPVSSNAVTPPSGVPQAALDEVTFFSGIDGNGLVASPSFATWNGEATDNTSKTNTGAVYSTTTSNAFKYGVGTPGAAATISYAFNPASNWTQVEQSVFTSSMALWSAVANITFTAALSYSSAQLAITRGAAGSGAGQNGENSSPVAVGAATEGSTTYSLISIDTADTTNGFGPIVSVTGSDGYPASTIVHEIGHALGLGHDGPYNGVVNTATQQYGAYDTRLWSIMSYISPTDKTAAYSSSSVYTNTNWGTFQAPETPMMLDILAVQRLYGLPTSTPLSGGQVFGFNSNITGSLANYYNFSNNSNPVLTIWDAGPGNTLDLSGYTAAATVNMNAGTFSSVNGLVNDIGIAFGTAINSVVGGAGNDTFTVNAAADTIDGGAGANTVTFSGTRASYGITQSGGVVTVTNTANNVADTLTNIAILAFSDASVQTATLACYARGTRILTIRGEIAVEELQAGDLVATFVGNGTALKPILWLGHRRINLRLHPDPANAHPIRFRAGALAQGVPHRDLWVSPNHRMRIGDTLVTAVELVNGACIVQESPGEIEYWHIELDGHDVILAEGVQAETYQDVGNRDAFENHAVVALNPKLDGDVPDPCLPYAGASSAVRERLIARAEALGWTRSINPAPWIDVDGQRIEPIRQGERYCFTIPPGSSTLRLRSQMGRPWDVDANSGDRRPLGVKLHGLAVGNAAGVRKVALHSPHLSQGFNDLEQDETGGTWRWTNGDAFLPLSKLAPRRTVTIVEIAFDQALPMWAAPVTSDAVGVTAA